MTLGPHAAFIIIAYACALVTIGGMIVWVVTDYAMQRRALGDLEARGVTRRSAQASPPGDAA